MTPELANITLALLNRVSIQGFNEVDAINAVRAALMEIINAGGASAAETGEKE